MLFSLLTRFVFMSHRQVYFSYEKLDFCITYYTLYMYLELYLANEQPETTLFKILNIAELLKIKKERSIATMTNLFALIQPSSNLNFSIQMFY